MEVLLPSLPGVKLCHGPQKPLSPFFPWDSPLTAAAQKLIAVKNDVQWRLLTVERGFWVGKEQPPARLGAQNTLAGELPAERG